MSFAFVWLAEDRAANLFAQIPRERPLRNLLASEVAGDETYRETSNNVQNSEYHMDFSLQDLSFRIGGGLVNAGQFYLVKNRPSQNDGNASEKNDQLEKIPQIATLVK